MPEFLVMELTDNEAKFLHASKTKKTGLMLENAFSLDLSAFPADDEGYAARGAHVREKLKEKKITHTTIGLLIPKQHAIVRFASLPTIDRAEIDQMAQFKAEEFIPFNSERHIVSHAILRQDEMHGSDVLITAVDSPVISKMLILCREAKLDPIIAEVSSIGLVQAFAHHQKEVSESEGVLLLNIGCGHTDVSILKNGLMVATRSHSLGIERLNRDMENAAMEEHPEGVEPQDIATQKIKDWIERIVRFTRHSYEYAVREHEVSNTTQLFISGEGSSLSGLIQSLEGALGVKVTRFNPIETLGRTGKGMIQPDALSGMNSALGLLYRMTEEFEHPKAAYGRSNLLPDEVIEEQEASEKRVLLMISATMLVITLLFLYLAYDRQTKFSDQLADLLRDYNREMTPLIDEMEEKRERINIIESVARDRTPAMAILDQLTAYEGMGSVKTGGRLTLTEFKYSTGEDVTISGMALEPGDIGDFTEYLGSLTYNEQPIFREVGIPSNSPSNMSRDRGTVWSFSLTAELNSGDVEEES